MRAIILSIVLVAAMPAGAQPVDDRTLCALAPALTKLARAVDAYASDAAAAQSMRSDQLLQAATEHDPSLLVPFARYYVEARAHGRNSAVLVCTADQRQGLLEDAGCTARSDAHRWRDNRPFSCGFVLDLAEVCSSQPPPTVNRCR